MLEYRNRIRLEKIARDCGFEIVVEADDHGLTFASSLVKDQLRLEAASELYRAKAASRAVMDELGMHFAPGRPDCRLNAGFIETSSTLTLHDVAERVFQLAMSLPSSPLETYLSQTIILPKTTEAERLVVQRVGQEIFRHALDQYWAGRCAVTGVSDRPLLRASHIHPWSECSTDDERLDVYNGILLIADLDAAFDAALITFDVAGKPMFGNRLSGDGKATLAARFGNSTVAFADRHQNYLQRHRTRFAKVNA